MYKISDFSKIVGIPVRTLRYYAEEGILVPSKIDKYTNYRYYSEENIIECELIKLLKSLDFTLEEIKKYKNNINYDILEEKKLQIQERIYLLTNKYNKLTLMQQELQKDNQIKILRRDE